jgi:uncharacterized membrane protein (UPF0127 family)
MHTKKMIYLIISILIVFIVGTVIALRMKALSVPQNIPSIPEHYLEINGKKFALEISDTETKRDHGLSDRATLAPDTGMLFIFDAAGEPSFWMKDMHFPIDMIFLDSQYRVVTSFVNVRPETYPAVFKPTSPAQYVLEFNAGFIEQNRIIHQEQLKIK